MIKVGITGQSGFIGTHLYNFLKLKNEFIVTVPFEDQWFNDSDRLGRFVRDCDAIVHLAAVNRHSDPDVIYDTNLLLVRKLIEAMELHNCCPHVLFSSSTQESRDNPYGRSKHAGRMLFNEWAHGRSARFTGLVIPNVFGPFGNPYYNSVVATFCHQLTHGEQPRVEIDAELNLIFVGELVKVVFDEITRPCHDDKITTNNIQHTSSVKVSDLLCLLTRYKELYFDNNIFPEFKDSFELNLFNTFRSYMDHSSIYPVVLKKNEDARGLFVETVKAYSGGQFSFSTTNPGVTRGNHFHTRKIERFTVIKGSALIELRRVGTPLKMSFKLTGDQPSFVDMPVWHTHNITNTGNDELLTLFWISEFFNPEDPDTYFEEV